MAIYLKKSKPGWYREQFRVLLSSKHKGLQEHPMSHGWIRGYRTVPPLLQETIDSFDGKEMRVFDVLLELEKAALLTPGIWRTDIVLRTLRDPWNEDPSFPSEGYIMGLLIPGNVKIPMSYFRLI